MFTPGIIPHRNCIGKCEKEKNTNRKPKTNPQGCYSENVQCEITFPKHSGIRALFNIYSCTWYIVNAANERTGYWLWVIAHSMCSHLSSDLFAWCRACILCQILCDRLHKESSSPALIWAMMNVEWLIKLDVLTDIVMFLQMF